MTKTRHNLCSNPSFEVSTTGWTATGGGVTLAIDTTYANVGTHSMKVNWPSGAGTLQGAISSAITVTPNTNYTYQVWINIPVALTTNCNVVFRWFDSTGVVISNTGASSNLLAAGTYSISMQSTSPTNAATLKIKIQCLAATTAINTLWVDTVIVEQATTFSDYFDGDTAADFFYTYSWDGTAGTSTATATPKVLTPNRTWKFPDLRNGTTIHHISDTHFGTQFWALWLPNWMSRAQADMERLKVAVDGGHLVTGDLVNGYVDVVGGPSGTTATYSTEETAYKAFRDAIKANDGLPFAEVPGNHDLMGISSDGSGNVTTRTPRLASDWATSFGYASAQNAWDFKEFRVLTVTPDVWSSNAADSSNNYQLSTATIDWIDAQLTNDSRPTFLATHVPLTEQYGDGSNGAILSSFNPNLYNIIGGHQNLIGWLSGHRHNGIANAQWAETMTIAGRKIFLICGPGGGSGQGNGGNAYSNDQWGAQIYSSYMTLLDNNTLDIRFRNHLSGSWSTGTTVSETHRLLSRA